METSIEFIKHLLPISALNGLMFSLFFYFVRRTSVFVVVGFVRFQFFFPLERTMIVPFEFMFMPRIEKEGGIERKKEREE